ncbi:MAG: D-glycero-alpha-D-manno-heptose-1,7-bisphosphate 7-phosphatase [Bdellovibrionia bacterium]
MRKAIFLDRDGTLNWDPGYLSHPDQLVLLPEVGEALGSLKKAGFLLVVISNQSGVGRGLIPVSAIDLIHQKLDRLLAPFSASIDHYGLCFHTPWDECECRKPKPKLILDAAKQLQISLKHSYLIGDRRTDLLAGAHAGCRAQLLVRTGDGRKTESEISPGEAPFIGDSLLQVANWILAQENESHSAAFGQSRGDGKS